MITIVRVVQWEVKVVAVEEVFKGVVVAAVEETAGVQPAVMQPVRIQREVRQVEVSSMMEVKVGAVEAQVQVPAVAQVLVLVDIQAAVVVLEEVLAVDMVVAAVVQVAVGKV